MGVASDTNSEADAPPTRDAWGGTRERGPPHRKKKAKKPAKSNAEAKTERTAKIAVDEKGPQNGTPTSPLWVVVLVIVYLLGGVLFSGRARGHDGLVASRAVAARSEGVSAALPQRARPTAAEVLLHAQGGFAGGKLEASVMESVEIMESVENVGALVVGFGWLMACETVHRRTTTRRASWGSPRRNDRPRAIAGGLRVAAPRLLLGVGVGTPVVTPFELDPFRGGGGGGDGGGGRGGGDGDGGGGGDGDGEGKGEGEG